MKILPTIILYTIFTKVIPVKCPASYFDYYSLAKNTLIRIRAQTKSTILFKLVTNKNWKSCCNRRLRWPDISYYWAQCNYSKQCNVCISITRKWLCKIPRITGIDISILKRICIKCYWIKFFMYFVLCFNLLCFIFTGCKIL